MTILSRWFVRFLMFAGFALMQAMAPFIHAHAGAAQFDHCGLLHVHEGLASDASGHIAASNDHGGEIEVAKGVPARTRHALSADLPACAPAASAPPVVVAAVRIGNAAPPPHDLTPSAPPPHFTPPTLAPPVA